jgi:tRNA-modifying protein YgfZ
MTVQLNGVAALDHLGVIRVQGADAASFLQGQLTQDFSLLKPSEARLAAYCTAKGRMLASFVGWQADDGDFLLTCSRDLLAPTLKRLSMFVMRAKARLSDASAEFALYGLTGDSLRAHGPDALAPWSRTDMGQATLIGLYPCDGQPRALRIAPASQPAPEGSMLSRERWLWSEVRSGVATVSAAISEAFVPQMLNYESVGGVNFRKGCYPGQEVVARSQFRGALKRRAFIAHTADTSASAGQDVYHDADPGQPCGTVAQAAPAPEGGNDLIVSMQIGVAQGGILHLASADGPELALLPLPYLLLTDV